MYQRTGERGHRLFLDAEFNRSLGARRPVARQQLRAYREWVESFGLKIGLFVLDAGAILLDFYAWAGLCKG